MVSVSCRSDSSWTSCLACSKRACRSDIVAFPRIGARMTARGRRRVNRPAGHLWERLKPLPQGHRQGQHPAIVVAPPLWQVNRQRSPTRSEERGVGTECVRPVTYRGGQRLTKKKQRVQNYKNI